MIAAILFVSFAILLILGAPIAVCLGSSSVLAMLAQGAGRPIDTIMSSLPFLPPPPVNLSCWPSPSSSWPAILWRRPVFPNA